MKFNFRLGGQATVASCCIPLYPVRITAFEDGLTANSLMRLWIFPDLV